MSERPLRILRRRDLKTKIGLSDSSIDRRLDPRSPQYDPTFPKPIPLSASARPGAPVGFVEHEVDEWLSKYIERSRADPTLARATAVAA